VAFEHEVRDAAGSLLAQGQVRVACVAADSFRPRRLPAGLVARIAG
jgi:acyl-CoA thioesterase FadM